MDLASWISGNPWVTVIATFLAATLSGLGLGSAGLFVLYLTLIAGFGQTEAQGINLLFYLFSAGVSLLLHVRQRRISWRLVRFLVICALPGTLLGTYLAGVLDAALVRRLFGGMLVVSGVPALLERKKKSTAPESRP